MTKRIISLLLAAVLCVSLCGCGGGKYKVVKSLADCEYSIGFRNGDSNYHYIDCALKELSAEGVIDQLSKRWFGSESAVSFASDADALSPYGYIAPRSFIIGVDLESFPMCYKIGEEYQGFDIELAQKVCERLGWTLKIQPISSADVYVELNSGNIDCAWGGVVMDRSSANYTILATYFSTEYVLASKDANVIRNKTLYMGVDQSYVDLIDADESVSAKLGQITRVQGSMSDLFGYLGSGECDLILTTAAAVDYYNSN